MKSDRKEMIVLNENTQSIKFLCSKDKRLAKVISMVGEINYKVYEDSYAFLISQIIGQMLSKNAAKKIFQRLETLCAGHICVKTISALTDKEIKGIGTSASKVNYIRSLTKGIMSEEILFEDFPKMTDNEILKTLMRIHGIGKWSAKMYLIFVLDRKDVLPVEDGAFLQTYQWMYKTEDIRPQAVLKRCKKWSPYSSIAARYMYCALDMGLTKTDFHLYK